jgi:hypothetical protein
VAVSQSGAKPSASSPPQAIPTPHQARITPSLASNQKSVGTPYAKAFS